MEAVQIPIDHIQIGGRARGLKADTVKALADSIAECGLRTPITVAPAEAMEGATFVGGYYSLVSGHHRLEGCKTLGMTHIPAFVCDMAELDRQLWEIDENLIRAELTELERGEHLARRRDIYIARHPETRQHAAGALAANAVMGHDVNASDKLSFASETAAKTGLDKRTIQRSIRRAEKISADVKERIYDTPIADSGVELDALAGMKADDQKRATNLVLNGKAETIREAKRQIVGHTPTPQKPEDSEAKVAKAVAAVQALNDDELVTFKEWLNKFAPPKIKPNARGERLSDDWEPGEDGVAFATKAGWSAQYIIVQVEQFKDYWRAKAGKDGRKTDWPATWRWWVRNNYGPKTNGQEAAAKPKVDEAAKWSAIAEKVRRAQVPYPSPTEVRECLRRKLVTEEEAARVA